MKESIIAGGDSKYCFICNRVATDRHHCLHGSYRKLADEDGLTVNLCRECHQILHDKGINDKSLQMTAQMSWEKHYGSREDFMKRYGRSFIL